MAGYLTTDGTGLVFSFDYDPDVVSRIRNSVPNATWDKEGRAWLAPAMSLQEAVAFAQDNEFEVYDDVWDLQARIDRKAKERVLAGQRVAERAGLTLYPHQVRGIEFLSSRQAALLAWEQRCGKMIASLAGLPENFAVVVVCPATVKGEWASWFARVRPEFRVSVISGKNSFRWPGFGEAIIANWDILPPAPERGGLPGANPGTVLILDEVHKAKNYKAARTKSARAMSVGVVEATGSVWGLTGTPVQNSPFELWTLLETLGLAKAAFGSWPEFLRLFNLRKNPQGVYIAGVPSREVPARLARVMDRVLLRDVAPDIGPLERSFVPVDITSAKIGPGQEDWVALAEGGEIPPEFATYRRLLADAKAPAAATLAESLSEDGERVVVFSSHREPVLGFAKREGWGVIIGDQTDAERTRVLQGFRSGEIRNVACTIRAGGTGVDLSPASEMIFVDLDFNPTENAQALSRCQNLQKTLPVRARFLFAAGTVDERVCEILDRKTRLVQATLGETPPPRRRLAR